MLDWSKRPRDPIPPGAATVERLEQLQALTDEEKRRTKIYWLRSNYGNLQGMNIIDPACSRNGWHLRLNAPVWIFENYWYAYAYWLRKHPNEDQVQE